MGATMKVGDRVVIRHNPHDGQAGEDVLGEIVEVKLGAGYAGCDLAEVKHVVAGVQLNMPFSAANLEVLTVETAEALAADHGLANELADDLKDMADRLDHIQTSLEEGY